MEIIFGNKKFGVGVREVKGIWKLKGLMFCQKDKADNLLFNNSRNVALHSFFVFFDFLVLWLDEENRVVDFKIVRPWSFYEKSGEDFEKIVEIPVNSRNEKILSYFNIL